MNALLRVMRSRWVRAGFLVAALAAAVVAVWVRWADVRDALGTLAVAPLVASVVVVPGYLYATMRAWRAVLADLGSPLSERDAVAVFFVGQLGKYLPGSVWNVLATAELGADRQVPRRRSVAAMAVAILLSVASGLALGLGGALVAPRPSGSAPAWALLALPVLVVLVLPPVTNRLAALALRLAGRPPLEHALTARGTGTALAWTVLGWLVAGLHVWLLGLAAGMAPTVTSLVVCTAGYALAWSLGLLAVPVPAGAGVREVVLVAMLAGQLDRGAVLVVVLVSRVVLTLADLGAATVVGLVSRQSAWRR